MTRLARLALLLALAPIVARAATFPVLDGDPTDPATGDAYFILPGLPLITVPARHGEQPVVDVSKTGDVDLVVRAGAAMVGPGIPAPAATPVTGTAGGSKVQDGTDVPFTVVVSDGKTPAPVGSPLLGAEMDGLPVVVFAFADLDGDGVIGPTGADAAGGADDARELQEALYPVGRQVAVFTNGVATGAIAITTGAPASAGGLHVVLTAAAYVGPFVPGFGSGNIPEGPAIATAFPFLPNPDPNRVVDGNGGGGRAAGDVRIQLELEPVVAPLVGDPTLGTPFAIPTDGSDATVDRVVVTSGAFARARFVRPSDAAGFPTGAPVDLHPGAGGALVEPLGVLDVPDDGPGGAVTAQLVPVDRLDNVTDAPAGTTVTLLADPQVLILDPDTDGDPSHETIPLGDAAGVTVTLGDAGLANDSGAGAALTVVSGGFPTETLAVRFTPAAGTTTTTAPPTTTSTSTTLPGATTTSTSTTLPGATSTSTTAPPPTTTSTTVPPTCALPPSFAGAACRLATLSAAIDVGVPTSALQDRLTTLVGRARLSVNLAEQRAAGQQGRLARVSLRSATRALASLAQRLRTRAARRGIGTDVRAALLDQVDALQQELRALRTGL